jgi:hypothetical protein
MLVFTDAHGPMADIKRIRARISELAQRQKNVELSEIRWVVNQLGANGYAVSERSNDHNTIFKVNGRRFGVCHHNPGGKQIKACYVKEFLDAMVDVGLYED